MKFGLLGKSLAHSYSPSFFESFWLSKGIRGNSYQLIETEDPHQTIRALRSDPDFGGFNVTIPYKKEVLSEVDFTSEEAKKAGAANCVRILRKEGTMLQATNTDIIGFEKAYRGTLKELSLKHKSALILGSGGAAQAVRFVLNKLNITNLVVSRQEHGYADFSYDALKDKKLEEYSAIINCTPLGTFPKLGEKPDIHYSELSAEHQLIDLTYNPSLSSFLREGLARGTRIANGYPMLVEQALASWAFWTHRTPQ